LTAHPRRASSRSRADTPRALTGVGIACLFAALTSAAQARPTGPAQLCESFPDAPDCQGKVVSCAYCHESTDPPAWNAFGTSVKDALAGASFDSGLADALAKVEALDSDGDGVSNLDELTRGTQPGLADQVMAPVGEGGENPRYTLGKYDPAYAYRRVLTLYCGRSPSYDEVQAFKAVDDERAAIHQALAGCLQSEFWQKTQLPRLADKRIKPLRSVAAEATVKIGDYRVVIGDYEFDYRLWRYVLSADRDMRELLTADYFVLEGADGALMQTWDVLPRPDPKALAGGQPVERAQRAGMLTTQWFLAYNTMFSALPRTTAAQAYRAYLGADIAANEGLIPIQGEPVDIDKKGVAQERCAVCHSTLDPLAYAFMKYEGIHVSAELKFGAFRSERPKERIPEWDELKQQAYLFGKPVKDLIEWAHVAAESDEFARNMAEVFFEQALGRRPEAADQAEFATLWKSCREDGYSANRLIGRLVDTLSFGAP
jgi:hypothetical protein